MANTDFFKEFLSASVDGKGIGISASQSPGTLIHTAISTPGLADEVFVYAANIGAADVTLTLELGDNATGSKVVQTIAAADGLDLRVPGLLFKNATTLRGFTNSAGVNKVNVFGGVNRASA